MKQVRDKIDLIRSIRRVTLIIYAIGSFCFIVVGIYDRFSFLKSETVKIRSEYTDKQKQIIRTQVESTVMFINLAKESGISREEIIESVRKIRFGEGNDGYIFWHHTLDTGKFPCSQKYYERIVDNNDNLFYHQNYSQYHPLY